MSKTIKVGGVHVEIPDDSPLAQVAVADSVPLTAEKPDEPEKLESLPYVYRPNDPFQSNIDPIVAIGNVHSAGKPWVRKVFMFFFVILPMLVAEIAAVGALFIEPEGERWKMIALYNLFGLAASAPYLAIWIAQKRRNVPR